MAQLYGVSLAM